MAVFALLSPVLLVGTAWAGTAPGDPGTQTPAGTITSSTDVSGMFTQVQLSVSAEELDYTNFASGGWHQVLGGLASGTVQLTANQDFAASQLDAVFGLAGTLGGIRAKPYLDIKPASGARSATNPSHVLQFLLSNYTPLSNSVGQIATVQFTFKTSGVVKALTS